MSEPLNTCSYMYIHVYSYIHRNMYVCFTRTLLVSAAFALWGSGMTVSALFFNEGYTCSVHIYMYMYMCRCCVQVWS